MGEDNNFFSIHNAKLSLVLVGFGSAAFVVTIYHCVTMGWWHQFRNNRGQSSQQTQEVQRQHRASGRDMLDNSSLEISTAELIPAHKYQKGTGLVDDDGMCAVCLSQFEEGEELRTLPECLHSYHSPCIDMWLYSHSSCPMCRTGATPSPHISIRPLDSEPVRLDTRMLNNMIQYSRAI